jgi:Ca2+-binding RTX toxin-like protein
MATIRGKKGNVNDTLNGTARDDYIYGLDGDDTINAGGGNDYVYGGNHNDSLYGQAGHDRMYGEAGIDHLDGGDGHDLLDGGTGNDTLLGGAGEDDPWGGEGNDVLDGGTGWDELHGGLGSDTLTGGADKDYFYWDSRSDAISGDIVADFEAGTDLLVMNRAAGDANTALTGVQQWEFVTTAGAALANGNGQATITYADGNTVLQLYNNDGDTQADFTVIFYGTYAAEDLQIYGLNAANTAYSDPLIIFGP